MKSDSTPLSPTPAQEREARLTALLLGELSSEEAAAVRQTLTQDGASTEPSLARQYARLERTIELLRETVASPEEKLLSGSAAPKLSTFRREKLLESFKRVPPKEFTGRLQINWHEWGSLAAMVTGLLGVWTFLTWRRGHFSTPTWEFGAAGLAVPSDRNEIVDIPRPTETQRQSGVEFYTHDARSLSDSTPVLTELPTLGRVVRSTAAQSTFAKRTDKTPPAGEMRVANLPSASSSSVAQAWADQSDFRALGFGSDYKRLSSQVALPADVPSFDEAAAAMGPSGASAGSTRAGTGLGLGLGLGVDRFAGFVAGGVGGGGTGGSSLAGASRVPTAAANGPKDRTRERLADGEKRKSESFGRGEGTPNVLSTAESTDVAVAAAAVALTPPSPPTTRRASPAPTDALVPNKKVETLALLQATQPEVPSRPAQRGALEAVRLEMAKTEKPAGVEVVEEEIARSKEGKAGEPAKEHFTFQVAQVPRVSEANLGELASTKLAEVIDGKRSATIETDDLNRPRLAPAVAVPQPEVAASEHPFSTFSLNVSDVSFKLAAASLEKGQLPDPATIRSEEFINAFDYHDPEPAGGVPIAFAFERARYPFAHDREVVRFSVKTAASGRQPGRPLNLVLLLDNSGSMERSDRVAIIRECLRVLADQLQALDQVSVVAFARTPRLWIDGLAGDHAGELVERIGALRPEGGTNLELALLLAYQTAVRHFVANGVNRVVLLTDGAANLGDVRSESLRKLVEIQRRQGVALDCFGVGWEGYNDDLLESLSRNGDGRYGFVNTPEAAATGFAGQLAGALNVAASDVKVQVEFNPRRATAYRQIGYAHHQLAQEQFRDNTVDAAEIGAAEAGNALYLVQVNSAGEGPIATVRVRFKIPGTSDYREHEWAVPFTGSVKGLEQASASLRLAASASAFSEWLVASPYAAEVNPDQLLGYLSGIPEASPADPRPRQFSEMIRQAKRLAGK